MEISDGKCETPIAHFEAKGKMQSMAEEPARLRIVSFAIHSARGVIRDQSTRRWVMFITLVIAMLLLFCGTNFLQPLLSSRDHKGWFILFWLPVDWLILQ